MNHVTENIQAWLAGELGAEESARLQEHLQQCPACARAADEARRLWDDLALAEVAAPATSIWPQVRARTVAAEGQKEWFFGTGRLMRSSLATAAVAAGLLLGVVLPGGGGGPVGGQAQAEGTQDQQPETLWLSGTSWDTGLTAFETAWLAAEQDDTGGATDTGEDQ